MGIHFLEAFRSNLDLLCRHTVISEELVVGLISKGLVSEFYSNFLVTIIQKIIYYGNMCQKYSYSNLLF